MSRTRRHTPTGGKSRRITVRAERRDPIDMRKLSRALIALAQAQAEADAQAEAEQAAAASTVADERSRPEHREVSS